MTAAWLEPAAEERAHLDALIARTAAAFPGCRVYGGRECFDALTRELLPESRWYWYLSVEWDSDRRAHQRQLSAHRLEDLARALPRWLAPP